MTADRFESEYEGELLAAADEWGFESPFGAEAYAGEWQTDPLGVAEEENHPGYLPGRERVTRVSEPEGFEPEVFRTPVSESEDYLGEDYAGEAFDPESDAGGVYAADAFTGEDYAGGIYTVEGYMSEDHSSDSYHSESYSFGESDELEAAEDYGDQFGEDEGEDESPVFEAEGFPSGVVLTPVAGPTEEQQEHWDPNGTGLPLLDTGPAVRRLKLSANFTVGELVTSGGRSAEKARISPALVRLLQAMRDRAGKPVRITSGYRSWARNKDVYREINRRRKEQGKKPVEVTNSRHCSGQAADIQIAGLTGTQIAQLAIDAGGTELGIGVGRNYAHVDVRGAWELWTYMSGPASVRAKQAVNAHRKMRRITPIPPKPAPGSLPASVSTTPGNVAGGRHEEPRVPMLAGHRGAAPDLVLRWNTMSNPAAIDVVVHLHGYSGPAGQMSLPRHKEQISGLDFADPDGRDSGGRSRPTLALLPRGKSEPSIKRPDRFVFPALTAPGALDALVREGLRIFTRRTGISAPRGRLILTAHSGGGAALTTILKHTDPDEVHVFDAFYSPTGPVGEWARRRIERELAAPSAVPPALRVVYRTGKYGTARDSEPVARTVCAGLAGATHLAPRFRVEPTSVEHNVIPRLFGWRLLADVGADLPGVSRRVCGSGAGRETGLPAEDYTGEDYTGEDYAVGPAHEEEATEAYLPVDKPPAGIGDWESAGFALEELEENLTEPEQEAWLEGFEPEDYDAQGFGLEDYAAEDFEREDYTAEDVHGEDDASEGFEPEDVDSEEYGPPESLDQHTEPEKFSGPVFETEGFPSGAVLTPVVGATGQGQEHWDPNNTGLPLLDTGPGKRNLKLSANFTVGELVTSGGRAADKARISPQLVRLLQAMRDRVGKPVRINSGYRSWARNKAVYEARDKKPTLSRHCSGQAADIRITGLTGTQIAQLAIDAGGAELGIGVGSNYAHVDVRGTWTLWTYLSGTAAAQAKRAVNAHRNLRRATPAPPNPTPAPAPTPPAPLPTGPVLTRTPDRLAGVVRQPKVGPCTGSAQMGAEALARQWRALTGRKAGIYNCRAVRGTTSTPSVHGEGRAIDIYADAHDPQQRGQTDAYVAWLIGNAVELQVVYIIWNRRQWGWPHRTAGWRPYKGHSPHTDHAHVELSWEGARHPSPMFGGPVLGVGDAPGAPTATPQASSVPLAPAPASGAKLAPAQFLARYGPHARASQAATGVPALVTLAQAALESGWGARAAGFNFFGIKARATDPAPTRQLWRTREVLRSPNAKGFPEVISVTPRPDGRYDYVVRDWFRVYPDAGAAFVGHGEFLRRNRRYAPAFGFLNDPYAFAAAIAKAGYATDPSYGRVLASVMKTLERAGWRG